MQEKGYRFKDRVGTLAYKVQVPPWVSRMGKLKLILKILEKLLLDYEHCELYMII